MLPTTAGRLGTPRWQRLARAPQVAGPAIERCELCGETLPSSHAHLVDVAQRTLACACRACGLLFDDGRGRYRRVPERCVRLDGFVLDDAAWAALGVPVDVAFFFHSTAAGRVVGFYPSPAGAVESLLPLDAWAAVAAANPVLATMEPDVQALLVNRIRGAQATWLVPIDACYRLVGLVRTQWRGLAGGSEVWAAIARFFDELAERPARAVHARG